MSEMSAPFKELASPLNEYAMVCRGCLADSGEMKNMFDWGLHKEFAQFTDVQIRRTDGISELICSTCEESLTACKNFRSLCQQSDLLLRNSAMNKPSEDTDPINKVTSVLEQNKLTFEIMAPDETKKIYLQCPYSCKEQYQKKKDLQIHLNRVHNKKNFDIDVRYYCHLSDCNYSIDVKDKFFAGRKYLNQHVNKVHKTRLFICDFCGLSFATNTDHTRHLKSCSMTFNCEVCKSEYKTHDRLLVHMMRHHPDVHKSYKAKRAEKRKANVVLESKKIKTDAKFDYMCDSPKRSFATQTLIENNLKNDVNFSTWHPKNDFEIKKDEISTQTMFEDLLSLKSQSEEDSLFETVSLSDIQTQTFPLEFGLSRSNKETLTSETQSPDLSIKETQTCFCHYDSPIHNSRLLDSMSSSPCSLNLTSTETQTADFKMTLRSDVLLSCNTAETQTSFENERENL